MDSNVNGGKPNPIPVVFRRDGSARTAGAVTESQGGYAIADTSTTAKVGDIYRAETATNSVMVKKEYPVIAASTNSFTIASKDAPTLGDTFYILGRGSLRVGDDGSIALSVTGLATEAKQDVGNTSLSSIDTKLTTTNSNLVALEGRVSGSLVPEAYDYIATTYVGSTTKIDTVTYKSGGSGGSTVATLTMGYDGSDRLTSVTRS